MKLTKNSSFKDFADFLVRALYAWFCEKQYLYGNVLSSNIL